MGKLLDHKCNDYEQFFLNCWRFIDDLLKSRGRAICTISSHTLVMLYLWTKMSWWPFILTLSKVHNPQNSLKLLKKRLRLLFSGKLLGFSETTKYLFGCTWQKSTTNLHIFSTVYILVIHCPPPPPIFFWTNPICGLDYQKKDLVIWRPSKERVLKICSE